MALFCCMAVAATAQIKTPAPSPSAVVTQEIGVATVSIEYSRPSLKGRTMIGGDLIPFGKVWRTGANKVPNLKISDDVSIEGQKVAAGTYGVFTIPDKNEWTIILSKNPNQWGAYSYKQEEDVLRFKVKSETAAAKEEHFTMEFTDFGKNMAKIAIRWQNTVVKFSVANEPDSKIMADIATKMKADNITNDSYYDAADYYYQTGRDLKQALEWASKLVEKDKQSWTYHLRAKIAAKMGNCTMAIDDATKGYEMAKKENDATEMTLNQQVLKACGK
jgi:hypothetical protein